MSSNTVEVRTNLPDFKRQLSAFKFDIQKNVARAGMRAAGVVFKKRVEQLAPTGANRNRQRYHVVGLLKKNIILVRARKQTPGSENWFVTVRGGRAKPKRGAAPATLFLPFYWRWVEKGHRIVPRGRRITGGSRTRALKRARFDASGGGTTTPAWYLRNGFRSATNEAITAASAVLQKRIDKENRK